MSLDSSTIVNGIKSSYESFYEKIDLVNNIISTPPDSTPYWNVVTTVSDAVVATAISLACIYALVGFIKDGMEFRNGWEGIIKCLIRLVLTKGIISNSTDIMLAIYNIGAEICSHISCNLSMSSLDITIADNPDGLIECMLAYIKYMPIQLAIWVCGIIVLVISLGIMIQICIFIMFSPLALAQFAASGFNGIKNFLKDYFSVCLQGAVMMAAMSLFTVLLSNSDGTLGSLTDSFYGSVGLTVIYCIVLIKVLMSSQSWARKLLN